MLDIQYVYPVITLFILIKHEYYSKLVVTKRYLHSISETITITKFDAVVPVLSGKARMWNCETRHIAVRKSDNGI